MKKFKDLIKNEYFWFEKIQNEFYELLINFKSKKEINNQKIAQDLNVSKGRISQVLNGNINFTLKNLIKIILYTGKVPILKFVSQNAYLKHRKDIDEYFDCIEHENMYKKAKDIYFKKVTRKYLVLQSNETEQVEEKNTDFRQLEITGDYGK